MEDTSVGLTARTLAAKVDTSVETTAATADTTWKAQRTKKRVSNRSNESGKGKRRRVEPVESTIFEHSNRSESEDNALGISMNDTIKKSTWKCIVWPIDDEVEDEDDESDHDPKEDAAPATHDDSVPVDTPQMLRARLAAKAWFFKLPEKKRIYRWVKVHRTIRTTDHKGDFKELLQQLGYLDPGLSADEISALKVKTRTKLVGAKTSFRRTGAINDADGYESPGTSAPLPFAEWTSAWLKPGWDGNINKPTQLAFELAMNQTVGGIVVAENGAELSGGTDGLEMIVIEQLPDEPSSNTEPPADEGEEKGGPDPNLWYNPHLKSEIIASKDWNFRALAAQHLGLHLLDHAVLDDDPFPNYQPIAAESLCLAPSAPKDNLPPLAFTISPGAVSNASSCGSGSVSLGDVDSPDVDVPTYIAAAETGAEGASNEHSYEADAESDEDDELGDGRDSHAQAAVDTQDSSPAPTTPAKKIVRRPLAGAAAVPATPVRKPLYRTTTPVKPITMTTPGSGFAAIWSPKTSSD
ncbi:hypothetical protein JHW43_008351 [Diplocarpon mali]|nr:hypothetical protein JHW43_008351 [Diplocarpon mali]